MNLYEVIRWGNESDDPLTGGPNGPDTCFLVRAVTPDEAAALVDSVLAGMPSAIVQGWSHAVYLLGLMAAPILSHGYCGGLTSSTLTASDGGSGTAMPEMSHGLNCRFGSERGTDGTSRRRK